MKNSIYIILIAILIGSCDTARSWKNEGIEESIKAEIAILNEQIVDAMLTKDVEKMK